MEVIGNVLQCLKVTSKEVTGNIGQSKEDFEFEILTFSKQQPGMDKQEVLIKVEY